MRHLLLLLEGPLSAYGAEAVDARGVVRDWPGASLLTGLLANALGLTRAQREAHQALQDRLRFAVRLDRPGRRLTDFQTAKLSGDDRGWTTRGVPEGRAGGAGTYLGPHIRYRAHLADQAVLVALHLEPADETPTLEDLAVALDAPARPLFLGRKACPPAGPINGGFVEAPTLAAALAGAAPLDDAEADPIVVLPGDTAPARFERLTVCDRRNWISGVHGGLRVFRRGRLSQGGAG